MGQSKDLQVRNSSAGVSRADQPDVGTGSDLSQVTFDRPGLLHDEHIPTTFRSGAASSSSLARAALGSPGGNARGGRPGSEVARAEHRIPPRPEHETAELVRQTIASGVRQLEKPRRSNGRVVLRRIGWRATPDAVVITTAEQELAPRGEKRYAPSGPWQIEHRVTYRNRAGKAEKRVGQVPQDSVTAQTGPGPQAAEPPADGLQLQVARQFPDGAEALSFLPRSVRASVIARVPAPTFFDGSLLAYSDAVTGQLDRHEVNVLRMTESQAVVVQAKLPAGSDRWQVAQATYTLAEPEIEQV